MTSKIALWAGLIVAFAGEARAADYVPMLSFDSTREVARAFRMDRLPAQKDVLSADRKACVSDHSVITDAIAARLQTLSNTNRDAAAVELLRVIASCMARKGWRVEIVEDHEQPSRASRAAVDTVLENMTRSLPTEMDEFSDLVRVKRDGTLIVYSVQARATARSTVAELRRFIAADPITARSLNRNMMKVRVCEPHPHRFLTDGYSIAYEMLDDRGGLIWREEISAIDCPK